MAKLVILERIRFESSDSWKDEFIYRGEESDEKTIKNILRKSAEEYLSTEEGEKVAESTSYDFNWGDYAMYVPSSILVEFRLERVNKDTVINVKGEDIIYVKVNQDEVLCD